MNTKAYEAVVRISDGEWRSIAQDLQRYALGVSRGLRWRTRSALELPGGETVDSIVSKGIEKLFSADRDWDPEKEPDIRGYLRGVIDSLLNHLAESQDNNLLTIAPDMDSPDAPAWESGSAECDPTANWLYLRPCGTALKRPPKFHCSREYRLMLCTMPTNGWIVSWKTSAERSQRRMLQPQEGKVYEREETGYR